MKTFVNFRFLAALILGLAVAGAAVHGLHVLQLRHHAGFLLEERGGPKRTRNTPWPSPGFSSTPACSPATRRPWPTSGCCWRILAKGKRPPQRWKRS